MSRVRPQSTGPNRQLLVSASSLSTFVGCPARWAARAIEHLREPETAAQARGTAVHTEMEQWSLHGIMPKSRTALAFLPLAPAPGLCAVEVPVRFDTPLSSWLGYIDAACDVTTDGQFAELGATGHTVIIDFKTTSSLGNAKQSDELSNDPAANIYGWEAYLGGAKRVSGLWLYGDPSGRTRPVAFKLNLQTVTERMIELDRIAHDMQWWYRNATKANELPKNTGYCWAFRTKCPRYDVCDFTSQLITMPKRTTT